MQWSGKGELINYWRDISVIYQRIQVTIVVSCRYCTNLHLFLSTFYFVWVFCFLFLNCVTSQKILTCFSLAYINVTLADLAILFRPFVFGFFYFFIFYFFFLSFFLLLPNILRSDFYGFIELQWLNISFVLYFVRMHIIA